MPLGAWRLPCTKLRNWLKETDQLSKSKRTTLQTAGSATPRCREITARW